MIPFTRRQGGKHGEPHSAKSRGPSSSEPDQRKEKKSPKKSHPAASTPSTLSKFGTPIPESISQDRLERRKKRLDRHKDDLSGYLSNANSDKSGFDWIATRKYRHRLQDEYSVLKPEDPDFSSMIGGLRARALAALRKGITERNKEVKSEEDEQRKEFESLLEAAVKECPVSWRSS
ncbi:hypothetical protein ACEPAF_2475 [Sanghuangporus sanghuang]